MTTQASPRFPDAAMVIRPVLVVDDSRAQRRLLTRTLQKWGYETVEAESGEEALAISRAQDIDIVISDWMMPGMSGVDFCRAFRERSAGRPAYFILLTAQTEREVLAEGLESGADDFLSKPFSSVELRARLRAGERMVNAQKELAGKNRELSRTLRDLSDAYAAIERDLRGARTFQEGLVPERHLEMGSFEVSMLFRPSGHVGGDLVGLFRINDHELGVYSVDVSGHGVASALMTARVAGYLSDASPERNIALEPASYDGYRMINPCEILTKLNAILQSDVESDQYMTMAIAKLDTATGRLRLCQAGHPSPVIQRASGEIEFIELYSTPIGLIDEGDYAFAELQLDPGDRLMLYSDGITECPNPDGKLLDEEGLEAILRKSRGISGAALAEYIVEELRVHSGWQEFPDDLSAVLIERR